MSLRLISVVVPVYNEHDNIATCLRGLWRALHGVEHEILVVYDFDGDTTLGAIRAMDDQPPSLRLVKNDIGKGAANAIRAGFAAARGDVVVTTMADLSDPPEKILELADVMRSSGAAVVAGSRYMAGGTQEGGPLIKRTLSRIAGVTLRWIGGIGTHDATNNFKAYSKSFLDSIQVEAQGAFDIGLELTVKAHLAGRGVAEVPTSWRDRSAGESRFKVWAWAPKYLRWYWMAMGAPIAVLAVWLAAWTVEARLSNWTDGVIGIEPALSTAFALTGLGALWFARRFRGRTIAVDALIALAWCNPLHARLHQAGWTSAGPLAAAAITIALYVATFSRDAWSRVGARLRELASFRNALFIVLTLLVWPFLICWPHLDHTTALDPSWQRAFDHFLATGTRSGSESVFTYGPLGALHTVIWLPNAFWARVVLIEGLLKLCGAGFFVAAAFSMRGWFERTAWFVALPLARLSSDTAMIVVLACAGAALLARRRAFGPALFLACAMFVEVGFTKFTFQMFSLVCVALLVLELAARRQFLRAMGPAAIYAALYVVFWLAAHQNVLDLPSYWRGSLEITSGYSKSQADPALNREFGQLSIVSLCVAATFLARAFASRFSTRSIAVCVLTAAALALGFKASVVRTPMSLIFTELAMLLPLLAFAGTRDDERLRIWPLWFARAAAVSAIVLAAPGSRWLGLVDTFGWQKALTIARDDARDKLAAFGRIRALRETLRKGDDAAAVRYAMPRTKALVGDEPIDVLGVSQALAVFNGLNYHSRPILQAYSVHTPYLMRRNVEYFRGETAPRYVMMRFDNFQGFMSWAMEPQTYETVIRCYRPVLIERGQLLLERDPERGARAIPEPEILLERDFERNQWVDVPRREGQGVSMLFDVRPSLKGKIYETVFRGVLPWIDYRLADGRTLSYRITPNIAREGWLIDPVFPTHLEFMRWLCGREGSRVTAVRWRVPEDALGILDHTAKLTLVTTDLAFREPTLDPAEFEFPGISPAPTSFKLNPNSWTDVDFRGPSLRTMMPFEMSFDLPAGRFRWHATLETLPGGQWEKSDGIGLRVTAHSGENAEVVYKAFLPPPRRGRAQPLRRMNAEIELSEPGRVEFQFDGGPEQNVIGDYLVVRTLSVRPARPARPESDEPRERPPRKKTGTPGSPRKPKQG